MADILHALYILRLSKVQVFVQLKYEMFTAISESPV